MESLKNNTEKQHVEFKELKKNINNIFQVINDKWGNVRIQDIEQLPNLYEKLYGNIQAPGNFEELKMTWSKLKNINDNKNKKILKKQYIEVLQFLREQDILNEKFNNYVKVEALKHMKKYKIEQFYINIFKCDDKELKKIIKVLRTAAAYNNILV